MVFQRGCTKLRISSMNGGFVVEKWEWSIGSYVPVSLHGNVGAWVFPTFEEAQAYCEARTSA